MKFLMKSASFLIAVLVAVWVLNLLQGESKPDNSPKPWQVTIMPDGQPKVLGIHLGTTDLDTAEHLFKETPEVRLFSRNHRAQSIEAYFDLIRLGGLSAKVVLNIAVTDKELQAMLSRAHRGDIQPSGARQHKMAIDDLNSIRTHPISILTYIPSISLTKAMVKQRFGTPTSISQYEVGDHKPSTQAEDSSPSQYGLDSDEKATKSEIWHYPQQHLTVTFADKHKTVLIYQAR